MLRPILLVLFPLATFAQPGLNLLAHLSMDTVTLSGCRTYIDSSSREYALVGNSSGLSIFDLSDPTQPFQRFHVPGPTNNWRELAIHQGYAYVVSEASNSAVTIVDLRNLPDSIRWKRWDGDGLHAGKILRNHTVQASEGYLYLFGGGDLSNGAVICSIDDPWNPVVTGIYNNYYVHDGFIRGDTLWTSEIYEGQFSVVDISDRSAPLPITNHPTPFAFNHNSGLSDNKQILFTTDEKADAPLAAFDVSDLENIRLLDLYRPSLRPSGEVHNVRVFGNYLICPSYLGQLTIVDATRPDNLIEIARYDLGSSLVWDADPYLPSGIIVAGAKLEGLFVFQPSYSHAAWLEGLVTDQLSGLPLDNVAIHISDDIHQDQTDLFGRYRSGAGQAGYYTVSFSKPGYDSLQQTIYLNAGELYTLDVALTPQFIKTAAVIQPEIAVWASGMRVYMQVSAVYASGRCRLIDVMGREWFRQPLVFGANILDCTGYEPGGYWLQIIDEQEQYYKCQAIFLQ